MYHIHIGPVLFHFFRVILRYLLGGGVREKVSTIRTAYPENLCNKERVGPWENSFSQIYVQRRERRVKILQSQECSNIYTANLAQKIVEAIMNAVTLGNRTNERERNAVWRGHP